MVHLKAKHQDKNRAMSSMPYSARKNVINCILEKLNSPSISIHATQTCNVLWTRFSSTPTPEERQPGACTGESRLLVWKGRGVKEAIHIKLKIWSLNWGGGLRHFLLPTCNAELHSLGQNSKHSHRLRPDDSTTDRGEDSQQKLGQRPCQGPWQRPCQRLSGDHWGH